MWDLGFSFCSGFLYLTCFTKYSIILLSIIIVLTKASPVRILGNTAQRLCNRCVVKFFVR